MNDASALFLILSQPMIYRDEASLADKDPANDHSSINRVPSPYYVTPGDFAIPLINKPNLYHG